MAVSRVSTSSIKQGFPKSRSLLIGNDAYYPPGPASFDSISTYNIGSTTGSVTFSSISSAYKHLQVRYNARNTGGGIADLYLTLNGDTGSNYTKHWGFTFDGNSGGAPYASSSASASQISVGYTYGDDANVFACGIIDIHDYASTAKKKTIRYVTGNNKNTTGTTTLVIGSGMWTNDVNAVNSLTLNASSFAAGSTIALYGIKG